MKMTRNEYKTYLSSLVSRCYDKNDNYNFKNYREDADNVEILPLDLSAFPELKEETKKYIDAHFDEETTDKNGNYMLRGFIGDSLIMWNRDKAHLGCNYAPYGFYYSGFGFNDAEMLIYTWCEGDTTLTIFNDRMKYEQERKATEKWFDEN